MAIHKKKVETFIVAVTGDAPVEFETLLADEDISDQSLKVKGKYVTLNILQKKGDFVVGLVETSRNENIPPKKNRRSKKIEKLGLSEDESLAYANIFLYEKSRRILMYEVNKFGCYMNHFLEFMQRAAMETEKYDPMHIGSDVVLKANEYKRMLDMRFHKSVEVQFANPKQILNEYKHKNDAIFNLCTQGKNIHSEKVQAKFEVSVKGTSNGLASNSLKTMVDRVLEIAKGPNQENVKKLEVVGYESDSEEGGLTPIDLIADRFIHFIKLDEPRENSDLLEVQRQREIKELYKNCLDDFNAIFGRP
jgi:hypothetical protein